MEARAKRFAREEKLRDQAGHFQNDRPAHVWNRNFVASGVAIISPGVVFSDAFLAYGEDALGVTGLQLFGKCAFNHEYTAIEGFGVRAEKNPPPVAAGSFVVVFVFVVLM